MFTIEEKNIYKFGLNGEVKSVDPAEVSSRFLSFPGYSWLADNKILQLGRPDPESEEFDQNRFSMYAAAEARLVDAIRHAFRLTPEQLSYSNAQLLWIDFNGFLLDLKKKLDHSPTLPQCTEDSPTT